MTCTVYLYASFNCSLQAHWDYVKIARIAKLASPGLQQKNAIPLQSSDTRWPLSTPSSGNTWLSPSHKTSYLDKKTPVQVSMSTNNLFAQSTQNPSISTHLNNPLTIPMQFCERHTMLGPSDKYFQQEQSAGPSENNCESPGQSWIGLNLKIKTTD